MSVWFKVADWTYASSFTLSQGPIEMTEMVNCALSVCPSENLSSETTMLDITEGTTECE